MLRQLAQLKTYVDLDTMVGIPLPQVNVPLPPFIKGSNLFAPYILLDILKETHKEIIVSV